MKHYKTLSQMMALALASMAIAGCSSDINEPDKPFTTCPVEENVFYACGVDMSETRSLTASENILFSEDDIISFNINTREIKFNDMKEPLYLRLKPFQKIEFHLGDDALFVVSSCVGLWYSQVFDDLVLCYGNQESITLDGSYYLYDCYPLSIADTESVKANREKNKTQWETFIQYLDSKGKLINSTFVNES